MASISTRRLFLSRSLYHSNPKTLLSTRFCTTTLSDSDTSDPIPPRPNPTRGIINDTPLEDGVDTGIYKAILMGQVGQNPVQKQLKSGATVTVFSLGTGGIRNNRKPFQTENPSEYANRCTIQWHRVCIYPERLGKIAVQNAHPGSIMYVEGNLETKIFTDPITGLIRRLREIAVRKNGRIVFLGPVNGDEPAVTAGLRGVGYF